MSLTKAQLSQLEAEDGFYDVDVVDELEDEEETGQSIANPKTHPKPSTFISNVDRTRIIKAHLAGKRPKMIAEIMDLPQRRIEVIIRSYAKTGRIRRAAMPSQSSTNNSTTPTPRSPKQTKMTDSQVEMLRVWTSEDALQTGAQLTKKLNEAFGTNFTVPVVHRHLGKFLFSFSRFTQPAEVSNDQRSLMLRREFCQIYNDLSTMYSDSEVVYVGQMRFRLAIRDRADKQEKTRGRPRLRNMSVCIAMTREYLVGYMGQNPPIDNERFKEFMETIIDEQKSRGANAGVLIMDESCTKEEDAEALNQLVASKDYTTIYLPPNSPFLNPTEVLFGEFRELCTATKVELSSETMLVDLITEGSEKLIEVMDCPRYVESVKSYVPRCLNSEPIDLVDLHSIYAEACEEVVGGETITEVIEEYIEE